MNRIKILLIILISLSIKSFLTSEDVKGENLEVRLLVIGQGDPIYSLWGHTGIAIKNSETEKDLFFDFGNFNFEDDSFLKNFAVGRLLYIAWAAYTDNYKSFVISEKRALKEYVLDLSPEKKLEMYNNLLAKSKPENRTYLYHHYNDNCSTRIRDYIDSAVNGQINGQTQHYRGSTFRKSFLLFTSNKKIIGSFLSFLQGPEIDSDITLWQEMFLPSVLSEFIEDFYYIDENNEKIKLIKDTKIGNEDSLRKQLPKSYKAPYLRALVLSILLFALVLFSNFWAEKGKIKMFIFSNLAASLLLGLLGSMIFFLSFLTDHTYSFGNLNLLMVNPLALLIAPVALLYMSKGKKWKKILNVYWTFQLGLSILMVGLKALTPLKQDNLLETIIFVPLFLAFSPLIPTILKKCQTTVVVRESGL